MAWRLASALAVGVLLGACGDDPVEPTVSVLVDPTTLPTLLPGDEATLVATLSGPGPAVTWTSRNLPVATVSAGHVEAMRPGTTWVVASAGAAADSVLVTVEPRPGGYEAHEVDYFLEIAFGFEFGNASEIIRKWSRDVRIRVNGAPNQQDLATLDQVIADINELTPTVDMVLVDDDPLVEMHFASTSMFPDILPSWVPGNVGYFSLWWDATQHFTQAVVLIATDIDQNVRDHIIREEVTQTLGLAQDSYLYSQSIFYQLFSTVTQFASVDEAVIEMLYRPEVLVGMGRAEGGRVVRRLTRGAQQGPGRVAPAPPRVFVGVPGTGSGSQGGGRR